MEILSSFDNTKLNYEVIGTGNTALIFVHGWMGNCRWWDSQRDYFSGKYLIAQMDLAGHGRSGISRKEWSVKAYAEDIKAVADTLDAEKIILVGHSMSGANVVEAATMIQKTVGIVLVDTLKDLDQLMPPEQTEQFFGMLRNDYRGTIENVMPQFLFAKTSPVEIVNQISKEFLKYSPELSISALRPFYTTDMRETASKVKIPVRAINADLTPTEVAVNRKYFNDFDASILKGVGHYPMLENPTEFNAILGKILKDLNL
ncbi:alpha/beta fold hydrolase [Peredibacter starrii]|uniref:Alpha/beta hydrolase n=1 Tax=Peredibacter starrii TaxID=28202 RepID=A0AAX4HJ89_9BACT|nr:alpha/beta hydrolase [Peredibacter starrii]WPU63285.1 alpha/beta hydrolase [Peredibacter starrii]